MIKVRRAEERGETETWWLMSHHTFSFNNYYDPQNMGWSDLRVINEDFVKPAAGFGTHSHKDMEIITYVLEGALEHKDSMGNTSIIRPGEVQRMTAGKGVSHSEFNSSKTEPVHLLQIWILPERRDLEPGYEQKSFPAEERKGKLRLVASRAGSDGSVTIHQDAKLFVASLGAGEEVSHNFEPGRKAWVQVARGSVNLNGQSLQQGDGAAISDEESLKIAAQDEAEILLFDLAA
ncbi:MAG: quercetin 2,3-dioxygenase [Acidobacteria bacterium 13_1_20CM_3_53_8]|nr:MAG: quercetin 2,3-dioxygenase [Acidobacteria bacterium 13_1_20CM_3_53_8]